LVILLYVDESGNHEGNDEYFVVGGLAVDEIDLEKLRREVQEIMDRILDPHLRGLELHASSIRTGRRSWRSVPRSVKAVLLAEVAGLIGSFTPSVGRRYGLFAVAREPKAVPYVDPVERTFEELYLRFNGFLQRPDVHDQRELGLVVADEAKYEKVLQPMVRQWRDLGTRRGRVRQVVEVPLFVDSKATRLLQLADFVAHAVYELYERNDDSLVKPLLMAFDGAGGVMHGLVHLTQRHTSCTCWPCSTRRSSTVGGRRGSTRG
jgi:hypothetical protein